MTVAGGALQLDEIQGNILGGFNKDFQDFLFLKVRDANVARTWVKAHSALVSTARQVLAFNNAFKALRASGVAKPETIIQARWLNIAFSAQGLLELGFTAADHGSLPVDFAQGMAARASKTDDAGASAPHHWLHPFQDSERPDVHVVLLLAADSAADLTAHTTLVTSTPNFLLAFQVLGTIHGRTRVDEPGHEHFGFKDGVSQPGIRGINAPDDPLTNPQQGHPGQDLLWPGEFVLGYPTQIAVHDPTFEGPNPNPGPASTVGNAAWTDNGSFLVFRRLQQDVPAFHEQLGQLARVAGHSVDLMGAKVVGRYRSGCPLAALDMQPAPAPPSPTDPAFMQAELADNDAINNHFEFQEDDPVGARVPLAAHIRKAYPRDETLPGFSPDDSESETQTHRLLRRGIPFGKSFGAASGGKASDPRGLLFLAYQKSIQKQFEFVQHSWVNDPDFPALGAGEDPILSQTAQGPFKCAAQTLTVKHFVTTTGGEYFFSPSLSTLRARF